MFAGDPARLELQSAFPRMARLELDHGSLVRAMFGGGFKARGLRWLEAGMGSLTEALAAAVGDDLRLDTAAQLVKRTSQGWVESAQI